MFKVFIVDDEPAALTNMKSILNMKCKDYVVSQMAENGKEALEKIKENPPDVVITDVKMPLMNGIELVTHIKEEYPEIFSIIVSGYQDFEYAKSAIQAGVSDYILKPIMPSAVQKTMDVLAGKLKLLYYQKRNRIIHYLSSGASCEENQINKYFDADRYYAAIIRKNGLPKRFSIAKNMEIYSDVHELMTIYGRDEMEALYIIPKDLTLGQPFFKFVGNILNKESREENYITCIYDSHSFTTDTFVVHIKELYRLLDTVSTVGYNQVLDIEKDTIPEEIPFDYFCMNSILSRFEDLAAKKQVEKLRKEILKLYQLWEEEKKPQLWLEQVSRQILSVLRKHEKKATPIIEGEYMLEDAFFYSSSMKELTENLMEIFFKYMKETEDITEKVDSPEFFQKVEMYLHNHISENISLQGLCKNFGVSQTYMSKLFRKYSEESFNQYVTNMRMKFAVDLMSRNPDIFVKEVASAVGYVDQFYFSRIFRSYTGKSPSDFMKEIL